MTTALEGGEGSASRPGRSLPPGKTRYPLYRRLGGPQGRSGQVRKISPPPGFDSRTVQPVASHYTDSATRPTVLYTYIYIYFLFIYLFINKQTNTIVCPETLNRSSASQEFIHILWDLQVHYSIHKRPPPSLS